MISERPLAHFQFNGQRPLAVLRWKEQPAWIAQELSEILEIKQITRAIRALKLTDGVDFEVVRGANDLKTLLESAPDAFSNSEKAREIGLIFESGLYGLIFLSRTDAAIRFRDWITREVLPSLRKQGFYRMPGTASAGEWSGTLKLFREALDGENLAVEALQRMGFTRAGDIPPDYRSDPGPGVTAELIRMARQKCPYCLRVLDRVLGLPLPPELQLTLPGIEPLPEA